MTARSRPRQPAVFTAAECDALLAAIATYEVDLEDRADDGEPVGHAINALSRAAGKILRASPEYRTTQDSSPGAGVPKDRA